MMKQVSKTPVTGITVTVANNDGINAAINGLNKNIKTLQNADRSAATNFAKLIIESVNGLDYIQNTDLHSQIIDEIDQTPLKSLSTYKRYRAIVGFLMTSKNNFEAGKAAINGLKRSGMNALHAAIAETKKELKRHEINVKSKPVKPAQKRVDKISAEADKNKVEIDKRERKDNIKEAINTAKNTNVDVMDAIASIKKIKAIFDGLNHEKLSRLNNDQIAALKAAELMLSKAFK